MCSRFSYTDSQKIDFTANGLHMYYPAAWELKRLKNVLKSLELGPEVIKI